MLCSLLQLNEFNNDPEDYKDFNALVAKFEEEALVKHGTEASLPLRVRKERERLQLS